MTECPRITGSLTNPVTMKEAKAETAAKDLPLRRHQFQVTQWATAAEHGRKRGQCVRAYALRTHAMRPLTTFIFVL